MLSVLTVALYTMSLLMQLFCSGHACVFLQLQLSVPMFCDWLFLNMRVLWLVIIDLTLLISATVTGLNFAPIENIITFGLLESACLHY